VAPPTAGRGPHHAPDFCEGGAGRPAAPASTAGIRRPAAPGRELPAELHLHLDGVSAEDLAAIIRPHGTGLGGMI
jgi:hypothetical protein